MSGSTSEKEAEGPSSLTNEVQSPREPSDADKAVIDSFLARVARADSWLSIKPAIGALRASDAFDLLTVDGRDQLFAHAYRRAKDINDPVRPAEDPEFYCAYLATNPPIEDADREFTRLVLSPAWAKLSDAHKEVIEDLNDLKGVNK